MSKSKSELSMTKRVLLDFIKFKTNNHHIFFASNEYIANMLDLTTNTAKTFVNDLIREGYLYKETDKFGRRVLSLTGKEFKPLFEDLTNLDKKVLKQEKEDIFKVLKQQCITLSNVRKKVSLEFEEKIKNQLAELGIKVDK